MKILPLLCLLLLSVSLACSLPQFAKPEPQAEPLTPQEAEQATPTTLWEATLTPVPVQADDPINLPEPAHPMLAAEEAVFEGDWPAALRAYQAALNTAADPTGQAAAQAGLGRVYYLSGDSYNAARIFQSLLGTQPDPEHASLANFFLAQIHMEQSRPTEAAQAYQGYLDARPGVIDTYIHEKRGDALQAAGDTAGALAAYQAALNSPRLAPNLDLEIKIAQAYELAGDPATALVMYADIYQRSEAEYQKAKVDLLQGRLLASQGQPEQAYNAWLDAVNNFPAVFDAYQSLVELVNAGYTIDELQRGIVDFYAGEYGVALAALDRLPASAPDPAAGHITAPGLAPWMIPPALSQPGPVIQGYPESAFIDKTYDKSHTQGLPRSLQRSQPGSARIVSSHPAHPCVIEFLFDAACIIEQRRPARPRKRQRLVADFPGSSSQESAFQPHHRYAQQRFISAQTTRACPAAGSPASSRIF
jgi:soluble lytic murein transglycosylase